MALQTAKLSGADRAGQRASMAFSFTVAEVPVNPYLVVHYTVAGYTTDALGLMVLQGFQPLFVTPVQGGLKVTYQQTSTV